MLKLVKLVAQPNSDNIVLDPFIGSGSTAVACKKLHVNCIGIDSNPHYIMITKKRLNNMNKNK